MLSPVASQGILSGMVALRMVDCLHGLSDPESKPAWQKLQILSWPCLGGHHFISSMIWIEAVTRTFGTKKKGHSLAPTSMPAMQIMPGSCFKTTSVNNDINEKNIYTGCLL
jgi:hypothetical protein